MARRRAGWPLLTAYWLSPARMAAMAAAFTASGPSKSGKPWPKLMAFFSTARRDISAKMLTPKVETRSAEFIWIRIKPNKHAIETAPCYPDPMGGADFAGWRRPGHAGAAGGVGVWRAVVAAAGDCGGGCRPHHAHGP